MPIRGVLRPLALLLLLSGAAEGSQDGAVWVRDLSFTGVSAISEGDLKRILATQESPWLPWRERRFFSRQAFEADLKRIVAFYTDRGFPNAHIASFDVQLSPDQESVRITIHVVEGDPLLVERIGLEGFGVLPDEEERALRQRLPLQPGQPLDRSLVLTSREIALDALRDHGYPYARVRAYEEAGSTRNHRLILVFGESGPLTVHGPIEIAGAQSVSGDVVRRHLLFRPGDVFRQTALRESQRRLYGLELFDFVNVEAVQDEARPTEIPTRVTVVEGDHRRVNLGVGYGSEERARGQADWRHVNFFGAARTAGVLARYSSLDSGVRLNFQQPYFFSPRYSLALSGQSWYLNEPTHERVTIGGRLTINRHFARAAAPARRRPSNSLAFTYANEWEDYTISTEALQEAAEDTSFRNRLIALGLDPRTGRGRGQLSAVMVDFSRNTTENLLDARGGYLAAVHVEQAGRWLQGGFDYYEVTVESRYYRSIGNRAVVALRARAGSIDTLGREVEFVPFFKRYFLGGATTLRGWGRFEVAPLSGAGLPLGGHAFMNFSTELRFPVFGSVGAVVFLDGGNVWTNAWDFNLNDLRYSAGPGLRYKTPVGPLRVDVGYQLNPIPGLRIDGEEQPRRFRFHFSIGHAF